MPETLPRSFLAALVLPLLVLASAPSDGAAQDPAQEAIRRATGRSLSQQEILQRLEGLGLTRAQVRQELRRRGYDPSLADPYFDQLEGRAGGALPSPGAGLVEVVNQLASPGTVRTVGADSLAAARRISAARDEGRRRIRVLARHLLLTVPEPGTQGQRDSVRRRANQLHLQLLGGADFGRLARENSDDAYSARNGGDLGWLSPGQMPPAFEEAAFSLEPGQVSRPVQSTHGIHLIRVDDREVLRVFGRDVFARPTSQFQPVTTGPVDPGYRLGPGDHLILVLTGDVEQGYQLDVTREGYVVIPDVGQVFVNGLTLEELEDRLYVRLGEVYSGVRRGPGATTRFDVSLGRLRTNLVYVIGDVMSPGAYQISSVGTVFNALHHAGGPTEDGSFRDVRVRRGGEVAARVDLYDYLVDGDASRDVRLQQGDVVFVPPAGPQVTVRGRVRRPATYELDAGEGLELLLEFAGGFRPDADVGRIQIDRILPPEERTPERERVLVDVSVEALRGDGGDSVAVPLRPGDRVAVFDVSAERRNRVSIRGGVYKPGVYQFVDGETVRGLIRRAGGLQPSAFQRRAHVRRRDRSDGTADLLRLDVTGARGPGVPDDLTLRDRDEVVVFSVDSLNAADSVNISGPVRDPGAYALARGMTAEDLILASGGFRRGADPYRAEVVRRRVSMDRSDTLSTRTAVAIQEEIPYPGDSLPDPTAVDRSGLVPAADVPLGSDDRVIVRELPGYPELASVRVVGQVRSPGVYVLETRDETVTDLVARAGGPTQDAYLEGFRLVRDSLPVGIDLRAARDDPHGSEDLPLKAGDSLVFPKYDPTVRVQGAVAFDARVRFRDGWGLDDYVNQAGGALGDADEARISVEYPNGERAVVNERPLFFDGKPQVRPGSRIFVPQEPPGEEGFDLDRFITRTVSILTTAATVAIAVSRF